MGALFSPQRMAVFVSVLPSMLDEIIDDGVQGENDEDRHKDMVDRSNVCNLQQVPVQQKTQLQLVQVSLIIGFTVTSSN